MPRAMKDSGIKWIGVIPVEWTTIKFKYLHNGLNTGEAIGKEYWSSDENDNIFYTAGLVPIKTNYEDFPIWKLTGDSDLLLARNGTPYIYLPVKRALYTDHIIRASMKDNINRRFVQYSLQRSIASVVVDSVSIATWSASLWNEQTIAFPPLEEQQRIASFLDDKCARIDSVIEKTRVSVEEYKKLKQALITRAVTKGIRPNRPMKHSGVEWLGDIPAEWEIIKLKYISRFMQTKYSKDDGQLNYIGLENVVGWSGTFIKTDSVYDLDQSLICEVGDILFGKLRPYLAKVYLNTSKQCCSGEFAVIRIDDSMCKRFFWYQLMSHGFIFTVDSSTYGTKMPRANAEYIKNISVVVPPLEEQKEIAQYLDEKTAAIDSLVAKKNQLAEELTSLKKSLIFEYVTGKKEVPT